nr:unnamed protein product [Callosobruchus analis]
MISKWWKNCLLDVRNKRSADVGSDHHLLIAEMRMKLKRKNKNIQIKKKKRFNLDKLEEAEGCKRGGMSACREALGYREEKRKNWITDRTWDLTKQRKEKKR